MKGDEEFGAIIGAWEMVAAGPGLNARLDPLPRWGASIAERLRVVRYIGGTQVWELGGA